VPSPTMTRARSILGGLSLVCAALSACSDYKVTAPPDPVTPPPPQTVQVAYCGGLEPDWVAFQDGDGPWTRAEPALVGGIVTFQHAFQSNRGGIATKSRGGLGISILSVLYGGPAELANAGNTRALFCDLALSKTLLGTVAGIDADEFATISGGLQSHTQVTLAAGADFALKSLPGGPHDLIGTRITGAQGQAVVTRMILRRDVDLPDSTTLPVFDFAGAEAFAPATATLTLEGIGLESPSIGVQLLSETSEILFSPVPSASAAAIRPYSALPLDRLRAGDLQALFASTATTTGSRFARVYFRAPTDRTLALPAALERPAFSLAEAAPFLRPSARFVPQADFDRSASVVYQQGSNRFVTVTMTAGYAALTGGQYELVVPDLSGTPGLDPAWLLHPGLPLYRTAGRVGGTLDTGIGIRPHDGATQRSAFVSDTIPGT